MAGVEVGRFVPQPWGDLVLRSPAGSSRRKPQRWELPAAAERRGPTLAGPLFSYFVLSWFGLL